MSSTPNDPYGAPGQQTPGQHTPGHQAPGYQLAPGYQATPAQHAPVQPAGYQPAPQYTPGPSVPTTTPTSVDLAKKLMWAGGLLQLLSLLLIPFMRDEMQTAIEESLRKNNASVNQDMIDGAIAASMVFGIVLGIFGALLWFLHAYLTGKGKGWARITATILFALYGLSFVFSFTQPNPAPTMIVNLLTLAIGAAAIFFLWRKDASEWFAAHSAKRA